MFNVVVLFWPSTDLALKEGLKNKLARIGSFSLDRYERVLRSSQNPEPLVELRTPVGHRPRARRVLIQPLSPLLTPPGFPPNPPTPPHRPLSPIPQPAQLVSPPRPMAYFINNPSPLGTILGGIHDLTKNLERFCPKYMHGESRSVEEHIQVFKDACTCA